MRGAPAVAGSPGPKAKSWLIEGTGRTGEAFSCSFVEFDERGDFLDFRQHKDCQQRIKELAEKERVLLVIYCHGWKNSSQSGDVVEFNSFLGTLSASPAIQHRKLRVHGVYLAWRGNSFRPYVDKGAKAKAYQQTLREFGEPIVDSSYQRGNYALGFVQENLSYWNRKSAAEDKASGLPISRAVFTYAATAKGYGKKPKNPVCVLGHSFGALMLEQSLCAAMTGALTLQWWETPTSKGAPLPFDMVLFVNSAAPAIYAKQMRDFLKAHRSALTRVNDPAQDAPVIISLTSSADWATGSLHRIGNLLAPFSPSLKRRYTTGIFGARQENGEYPDHEPIRQSEFYIRTAGHHPYLINHWVVPDKNATVPAETTHEAAFHANLEEAPGKEDQFITSEQAFPAAAWRITDTDPVKPVTRGGLPLSMRESGYWIVGCGKEIIGGHNDVWSPNAMELYAALFRLVEERRAP